MIGNLALNPTTFLWSVGIAAVLAAATAGSAIWYVKGLQIDAIQSKYRAEAAEMATKVATANGELSKYKLEFSSNMEAKRNELDKDYANRVADINTSVGKLANIRLRDPSAAGNSGSTGGQGSTQGSVGSDSGGALLSQQTSQFLWSFAGESDIFVERLRQCKDWNAEITNQYQLYYNKVEDLRKKVK